MERRTDLKQMDMFNYSIVNVSHLKMDQCFENDQVDSIHMKLAVTPLFLKDSSEKENDDTLRIE